MRLTLVAEAWQRLLVAQRKDGRFFTPDGWRFPTTQIPLVGELECVACSSSPPC